jgi:hypothetical protein
MLEDFPDEHSGFHVDRSVYDGYRDWLQDVCHEGQAAVAAIQRGTDESGKLIHWILIKLKTWPLGQMATKRYRRNCAEIWRVVWQWHCDWSGAGLSTRHQSLLECAQKTEGIDVIGRS